MSTFIDRRLNPKDKAIRNRRKFIERSKQQIKQEVKDSIATGNIADIDKKNPRIKVKGISEPQFEYDRTTGRKQYVLPGNKDFVIGDKIRKPDSGQSEPKASDSGEGEDGFDFILDKDEYLDFLFEELELPDLIKAQIKKIEHLKHARSGFTNTGSPSRMDIKRTTIKSFGRRLGLARPKDKEIEALQKELDIAIESNNSDLIIELKEKITALMRKQKMVPWIDPVDVRYRNYEAKPQPSTQAVMFCVMDVSASMGDCEKDLAKRFFFLLHLFLQRKYTHVEIVFVRHHQDAKEVDEYEFFHSKESGGTVVSSAIKLVNNIIEERYPIDQWNIYVAQASDGDNFPSDTSNVQEAMRKLLPMVQYFAYVEILNTYHTHVSTDLWNAYDDIEHNYPHMQMKVVEEKADVWKVFRELFSRQVQK